MQSNWQWNKNTMVDPEQWSIVAPSFYDAPDVDPKFMQTGIIDKESLSLVSSDTFVTLKDGGYAAGNNKFSVMPSEYINIAVNTLTKVLPFHPSNAKKPIVSSYKYVNGFITLCRPFLYVPMLLFDNVGNKFTFDYLNDVCSIELNQNPVVSYVNQTIALATTWIDGTKVFPLPEFPAVNIVVTGPTTYIVDNIRGLVLTKDAVSSITVSCDAVPGLSYVPENTITENIYAFDKQLVDKNFLVINNSINNE